MNEATRVCGILVCALGSSCSVYDESLLPKGSSEHVVDGGDAIAFDATTPDAEDGSELPDVTDEEATEASSADAGAKADVANPGTEDADARAPVDSAFDVRDGAPDEPQPQPPGPTGIVLSGVTTPSGQQSPTTRGDVFSQLCMPNEVVIGYTGTIDPPDASVQQLRTFQAICGSLAVSGTATFGVSTRTAETLPVVGLAPGAPQSQLCNANEIVVGFGGRSGSDIDQFTIICAPLNISGTAPNYVLSIGTPNTRPPLGGPGGNPFTAINCPAGEIAVGNEGRAHYTVNSFGLLCKTPALVLQ